VGNKEENYQVYWEENFFLKEPVNQNAHMGDWLGIGFYSGSKQNFTGCN
jgi:hypothetical protein